MKIGIHQPYLFPYLGYFQLIAAVDRFVLYDDVHFINKGWINRNCILGAGAPQRFTLELHGASQNLLINQIRVGTNAPKLVKTFAQAYRRAPRYAQVMPEVEACLLDPERNLANYVGNAVRRICRLIGISSEILVSSELALGAGRRGPERILAICQGLGGTTYINAIGGRELYQEAPFTAAGIALRFHRMGPVSYPQFGGAFVPNLSVVDALMFNPPEALPALLAACKLIRHDDP